MPLSCPGLQPDQIIRLIEVLEAGPLGIEPSPHLRPPDLGTQALQESNKGPFSVKELLDPGQKPYGIQTRKGLQAPLRAANQGRTGHLPGSRGQGRGQVGSKKGSIRRGEQHPGSAGVEQGRGQAP
jgi:hypothetical protein